MALIFARFQSPQQVFFNTFFHASLAWFLIGSLVPVRLDGGDWPHFLGPHYDGTSDEKGIRTDWSNGQLPLLWSRPLGTSYGIGAVAQGKYFQLDRFGSDERLTCLDATTGELRWESNLPVDYEDMYGYNNGPRSTPAVAGDVVVTLGVAGELVCRQVADGRIRWRVNTNQKYGVVQNFFGVGTSPIILEGLVIVMVGGSPERDQRLPMGALDRVSSNGSAIVAFDLLTGTERYRSGDYLASYSTPRPMNLEGREILIALVREGLLAIDPANGKELFMFPWRSSILESVNAACPLVKDRQVLISECYGVGSALLEIEPRSLAVSAVRQDPASRRQQSIRAHWATPIRVGEAVYASSGRNPNDSDLRCVDWRSGEVQWVENRRERVSLLGIDGHLIVLGEYGRLDLIAANSQRYQWVTGLDLSQRDSRASDASGAPRPTLDAPCWAAPIVAHGRLYVRGNNHLLCFSLIP